MAFFGLKSVVTRFVNRFEEIIARSEVVTESAIDVTAERIVNTAAANSRVLTGQMRDGWQWEHTETAMGEGALIYNDVEYTIFHEYGTVFMSAQPMLAPALEEHGPEFIGMIAGAYV